MPKTAHRMCKNAMTVAAGDAPPSSTSLRRMRLWLSARGVLQARVPEDTSSSSLHWRRLLRSNPSDPGSPTALAFTAARARSSLYSVTVTSLSEAVHLTTSAPAPVWVKPFSKRSALRCPRRAGQLSSDWTDAAGRGSPAWEKLPRQSEFTAGGCAAAPRRRCRKPPSAIDDFCARR
jgi:hypothetical protein